MPRPRKFAICLLTSLCPVSLLVVTFRISMLLPRYKFEIANDHGGGYLSTLVLPMNPGLEMRVSRRRASDDVE